MCGIAGILSLAPRKELLAAIRSMAQSLRHRGPDDEGYVLFGAAVCPLAVLGGDDTPSAVMSSSSAYAPSGILPDGNCTGASLALGHRRLAIQDLSPAGHQPMCTADKRHWIVYNGEIYNYLELRKELESLGVVFHSRSDTEVVLHAYRNWGTECLNRFNGMWAFIIYDTQRRKVFIARDRFGIKPLYTARLPETILIASEIKSILSHPSFNRSPDLSSVRAYLARGPEEFGPKTFFSGIRRFPMAHFVESDVEEYIGSGAVPRRYWQLRINRDSAAARTEEVGDAVQRIRILLADAVRLRLRSDVRVGSALSGGLDSSAIVHLINQQLRRQNVAERQETFSSIYPSAATAECDESAYINKLAGFLKVRSNQIEPDVHRIPDAHRRMIYAMDNPPESTCMSAWFTFSLVRRQGVVVTLDGQGADELFGGYLKYLTPFMAAQPAGLMAMFRRFKDIPNVLPYLAMGTGVNLLNRFLGYSGTNSLLRLLHRRYDAAAGLNEALAADFTGSLVNLLHFADRTSMAFSIESRMPYMDYRLVEKMFDLPASFKVCNGWTKYLLRKAMAESLPEEIVWRRDKMGWPIPEGYWLRGPLRKWFLNEIQQSRLLKEIGMGGDICRHLDNRRCRITELIRLLNLAVWYEVFFESASPPRLPGLMMKTAMDGPHAFQDFEKN